MIDAEAASNTKYVYAYVCVAAPTFDEIEVRVRGDGAQTYYAKYSLF